MKIKTISLLSTLSLGLMSQNIWAGNITAINLGSLPNQQRLIKIQFDEDVALPRGFTTESPARIALDFAKTGVSLPQNLLKFDDKLIKQIEAGQTGDRTRLLLSLNQPGQYNARIKGNEVWIYVQQSVPAKTKNTSEYPQNALPSVPSPYAPANNIVVNNENYNGSYTNGNGIVSTDSSSVNIDFKKGANASGLISITGISGGVEPTIKRKPGSLTLTFKNIPLKAEQQRNLDVADFSTPVQSVRLRRIGNDTEISMQMRGSWDYNQLKQGNSLVIKVDNKIDQSSQALQANNKSFKGRKISLDFQDIDVRTILQILAKESGTNIVASDAVNGKMTISLKDVPWDQALDLVLESRNLYMKRNGNVINIVTQAEQNNIESIQQENQYKGVLITRSFKLKYRKVDDFEKILNLSQGSNSTGSDRTILSSRGSALTDPGTNTLIITDVEQVIKKFEKLIAQTDVPSQQVLIEARIVETTDGYARELGTKFGYSKWGKNTWNGQLPTDGSILNQKPSGGNAFNMSPNINLGVANPTSVVSLVHEFASGALALELSASQSEGKSKIISSPRVLTQDRKEAKIESGYEVPYQETAANGGTSVSFKDAVLGLKVVPHITPDGNIIMTLDVQNDRPIACTNLDASITRNGDICMQKRNVVTQAMIENGGTLIIGGIYNENNENSTSKVPLLGDIPGVGNLFKYKKKVHQRNELLVFITPRIVESGNDYSLQY
ncbi:type IV pilus secretin PilQ [Snodgrassella sp. B3882]|uniref:type IV pilus secretin PilQ n=1 Tax=Snodgrassella sp. B3882 TaxID=2818037 RepID=UPI00226A8B7F|nr:type IV pilus secretin PilQ [Snodgrassella sp. B3882]MCX8744504.1 type IV pilus secretin PilQ [Snodgrassella sp. B3882]